MNSLMMMPSKKGALSQKAGPEFEMLVGRLGLGVDADLGDEPLPLAMPVVDDGLGQLDVAGHDQRGHVRQDVLLEKLHVVRAVGLDRGLKPKPQCISSGIALTTSLSTLASPVAVARGSDVRPWPHGAPPRHAGYRLRSWTMSDGLRCQRPVSSKILTVPVPLHVAEMKIQPGLERVNGNELAGFEIDSTSRSSETKLFRCLAPVKTTFALFGRQECGQDG